MGFSVSGATAVIFVGLLVSAATVFPALERSLELRQDALDARDERSLDRRNTAIELVEASYDATNDTLTVTVENTGARALGVDATDLLVDGDFQTTPATAVEGDPARTSWAPAERLRFELSTTDTPARVTVVTEGAIAVTGEVS